MTAWTPRQRAMLAEMGIAVWGEGGATEVAPVALPDAPAVVAEAIAPLTTSASPPRGTSTTPAVVRPAADTPAARRPSLSPDGRVPPVGDLDWPALRDAAAACTACDLCRGRTHSVFGSGRRGAHWLVVGEPPDDADDAAGAPFAGPPGQLLDNMLRAVGVFRAHDDQDAPADEAAASLTTVVKCRPPDGRPATAADIVTCRAYLMRQIELLQPRIVLAMGRWAARSLLESDAPLGRLRGTVHTSGGVRVVVTYDPGYLLRNPQDKAKAWADLCLAADTVAV